MTRPETVVNPPRVAWLSTIATIALLVLGAPARGQTQDPPKDEGGPGEDGRGCSASQFDGHLGAGSSVLGDGFEVIHHAASALADVALYFQNHYGPEFLSVPIAGDRYGTVNTVGIQSARIPMISLPSLNGYRFDLTMVYRMSTCPN